VRGEDNRSAIMPLTKLANTAIDGVVPRRDEVIAEIVPSRSTIISAPADKPAELARRRGGWDRCSMGGRALCAPLMTAHGVTSIAQPESSLSTLRKAVEVSIRSWFRLCM